MMTNDFISGFTRSRLYIEHSFTLFDFTFNFTAILHSMICSGLFFATSYCIHLLPDNLNYFPPAPPHSPDTPSNNKPRDLDEVIVIVNKPYYII